MEDNIEDIFSTVILIDKIMDKLPQWLQDVIGGEDWGSTCDAMFGGVDTDGNGVLTPDELFEVLQELVQEKPVSITIEHCRQFADIFDTNQDGVISKTEFKDFATFCIVREVLMADQDLLQEVLAK